MCNVPAQKPAKLYKHVARCCIALLKVQVSDTTEDDSSNADGKQKIQTYKRQ